MSYMKEDISMKKLLCTVLALVLCFALCSAPALAASATIPTAKAFCAALDEADIVYTCKGLDSDGDDMIEIEMTSEEAPDYTLSYIFSADCQDTYLRIYYLIDVPEEDLAAALLTCNELNYDYRFARFYLDTTDNTVTLAMDILHTEETSAELMLQATIYACSLYEIGYNALAEVIG